MTSPGYIFTATNGTDFLSAVPVAQAQVLWWWTELPSTIIDALVALWSISSPGSWRSDQQPMFTRLYIPPRQRPIDDDDEAGTELPYRDDYGNIKDLSSSNTSRTSRLHRRRKDRASRIKNLFIPLQNWHDGVWGRPNEWHFNPHHSRNREYLLAVLGSYLELILGLMATTSQAIAGLYYIYVNRNTPALILPMTANAYLQLFAVVTLMHSPRLKSNMFSFIWLWLDIFLTFTFQLLLVLLPVLKGGGYAPLFIITSTSNQCIAPKAGCGTTNPDHIAISLGNITCANDAQLASFLPTDKNILPWEFNIAFIGVMFIALLAGLLRYRAPDERYPLLTNIFRHAVLPLLLLLSAVSLGLQAYPQYHGVSTDFTVCPRNATVPSNFLGGYPGLDCTCARFDAPNLVPPIAEALAIDGVFGRFWYNII